MDSSDDDQASDQYYGQAGSSSQGHGQSEQELPHSVRGAPEHMRAAIRRRQNTEVCGLFALFSYAADGWLDIPQASRRSRHRQNEQLREVVEKCEEQTKHINELEERIKALVTTLEEAGIKLPADINGTLCDSLGNSNDPNTEHIFQELTRILDDDENEENDDNNENE